MGEVRALRATRLAEEPELTNVAERTPIKRARLRWKLSAKRPVVNQPSRTESTTEAISEPSITLPETRTGVTPGINSPGVDDSSKNRAASSRICLRRWVVVSDIIDPEVQIIAF